MDMLSTDEMIEQEKYPPTNLMTGNFEKYGSDYRNCACVPRKFIIDISDRMKRHVRTSERWKREYIGKWDFTSCVVFTFDPHDSNNTSSHSVYKVCLNMGNGIIFQNFDNI